jgi:eukaryotic-like serine/threonine-protein kinase
VTSASDPPAFAPDDRISSFADALDGRYRLERELGAGGMATVYLAEDARHHRPVAIKVLHPELSAILGPERFLKEIELTASLQHPHILPLFDSGSADGRLYYVMPLVEGETLRARLERERQLPISDAVQIASEVADALQYAHGRGVVHRDIKPENILLQNGHALVADFGIALAVQQAGGSRMTQTGLSLGTPQYMSPEQAMGERSVDARTDIYSLGAVTYEMLAGQPPFTGPNAQAIVAQVLTAEPPRPSTHRKSVPAHVDAAVETALAKVPADRFATAREFAEALSERAGMMRTAAQDARDQRAYAPVAPRRGRIVALACAGAVAATALGAAATAWYLHRDEVPPIPVRFTMQYSDTAAPAVIYGGPYAVSPDGRAIAYIGGSAHRLFIRPLGELVAHVIAGPDRALFPAFSPDGKWIAFVAGAQLAKVSVDGGPVLPIAEVDADATVDGITWARDRIVFARNGALFAVSAAGGAPTILSRPDSAHGERQMYWPRAIGDGTTILYTSGSSVRASTWKIGVVSLDGGGKTVLDLPAMSALGVAGGALLYATVSHAIMAVPFDAGRRRLTGSAVVVIDTVNIGRWGDAMAALSARGTLVYETGASQRELDLVSAGGAITPLPMDRKLVSIFPRFSPDGRRLALSVLDGSVMDIWVYDMTSNTLQRLTTGGGDRAEWTADGKRLLFRTDRNGTEQLWWQRADAGQPAESLFTGPAPTPEGVISPDGAYLVYRLNDRKNGRDLWFRHLTGNPNPTPIATSGTDELMPRVSPNGRWLAYVSEISGRREVYVRSFPVLGGVFQVSAGGGDEPLWSRDGSRIYYRAGREFVAAALSLGAEGVHVANRQKLFEGDYVIGDIHASWDVAPDGRFIVVNPLRNTETIVVHDWHGELEARLNSSH